MAQKAEEVGTIRTVANWVDGDVVASDSDRYGDVFDSATGELCARGINQMNEKVQVLAGRI